MQPTHPYIETHEGWFSTSFVLRSPSGDELARYESLRDAEDALRALLRKREGGGLLSWLF